ncbi:hypothetical protein BU16DRAFT_523475 [Lophium mytilinum]|uniref:Uncharacterized protein n=1 Tax=Lophium mytilinum TaxID=390894 RepID=A0A6A6R7X8_9PEZI|nr:hypothetical protein BU16DRAFT_523475 [Lophium mytilinum]
MDIVVLVAVRQGQHPLPPTRADPSISPASVRSRPPRRYCGDRISPPASPMVVTPKNAPPSRDQPHRDLRLRWQRTSHVFQRAAPRHSHSTHSSLVPRAPSRAPTCVTLAVAKRHSSCGSVPPRGRRSRRSPLYPLPLQDRPPRAEWCESYL